MAGLATVNELIVDRAIRHAISLHNLANDQVQEVVGGLNDYIYPALEAAILQRLSTIRVRGFDIGPATTQRLRDMLKAVRAIIDKGTATLADRLSGNLSDLAKHEAAFTAGLIGNALPIAYSPVIPSDKTLRTVFNPVAGSFRGLLGSSDILKNWDTNLAADLSGRIEQTIRTGIVTGQTTDQIISVLRGTADAGYTDGVWQTTRRSAEKLVRTATNHVATVARDLTYKENADLISEVQLVATLDAATCEDCAALDGETYAIGEGDRPPLHWDCRCTTIPVLKSWKDLGINADEIPASTRASMDGQVADTVTYDDWLRGQPQDVIDEALGPTRAKLFLDGELNIKSFVGTNGRLTLDQLAQREADAFARAGVTLPMATGPVSEQYAVARGWELLQGQGGGSINLYGDIPTKGYAFAPAKTTEQVFDAKQITVDDLEKYVADHHDTLKQDGMYLGSWTDAGKTYIDVSQVATDEAEAVDAARKADQIALYDIENAQTKYIAQYEKDSGGVYTYRQQDPAANSP